jgi:hypothetical protein
VLQEFLEKAGDSTASLQHQPEVSLLLDAPPLVLKFLACVDKVPSVGGDPGQSA